MKLWSSVETRAILNTRIPSPCVFWEKILFQQKETLVQNKNSFVKIKISSSPKCVKFSTFAKLWSPKYKNAREKFVSHRFSTGSWQHIRMLYSMLPTCCRAIRFFTANHTSSWEHAVQQISVMEIGLKWTELRLINDELSSVYLGLRPTWLIKIKSEKF